MAAACGESFNVQLVRKTSGEVVYIECDHDLVACLAAYLHQPLGALATSLKDVAPELGAVRFGSSMAALRDAIWHGNKHAMMPRAVSSVSSKGVKGWLAPPLPEMRHESRQQASRPPGQRRFAG